MAEETRECRTCGETRLIEDFKPVPGPGKLRSPTCFVCQADAAATNKILKSEDSSRDWIIKELVKQYRAAKSTSEKIRCLETLAKLQPESKATQLDDPQVIQSLMKSMKTKKIRDVANAGTNSTTDDKAK
ncbi:MAG: hypothetical protein WC773_04570 [Patescibacteria group bacterium]|jgi:hypothetical protein